MILSRINYGWRLLATGGCFAIFGLGGLTLSALVFPLLALHRQEERLPRTRRLIQRAFALFLKLMVCLGIMRLEVSGAEKLKNCRHMIVLANHPTLIDVVALISLMPNASCVVKEALWKNRFLGGVVRAAGYISNAGTERLVEDCAADLRSGRPLLIFPEGTRIPPGESRRFKTGGAHLAVSAGVPVVPVAHNAGEFWAKNAFVKKPGLITVSIGPAIDTAGKTAEQVTALAEQWVEAEMRRLSPHRYPDAAHALAS